MNTENTNNSLQNYQKTNEEIHSYISKIEEILKPILIKDTLDDNSVPLQTKTELQSSLDYILARLRTLSSEINL